MHFNARTAERHTYFTISWMAAGESYGLTGMVHKVRILRTINSTYSKQNKTKQNKAKQNKNKNPRKIWRSCDKMFRKHNFYMSYCTWLNVTDTTHNWVVGNGNIACVTCTHSNLLSILLKICGNIIHTKSFRRNFAHITIQQQCTTDYWTMKSLWFISQTCLYKND